MSWALNGRFFDQPVTGVQRYAREIVGAMDSQDAFVDRAVLLVPPGTGNLPSLRRFDVRRVGFGRSHLWEQTALAIGSAPLLNLCNAAPLSRPRQVVCLHDANVFLAPQSYSSRYRSVYRVLMPLLALRASVLTTVSKFSADALGKSLGVPASRFHVIPNGHEHVFRWKPELATRKTAASERPYVLLLGSRAHHKNSALIVDLAEELRGLGLGLKLVGGSAGVFAETATGAGPQSDNVEWLGHIGDDDLAYLLQHALCLAFPSFVEGFGLPVVEAMALGCPVVSSNATSLPEVCGDAALLASPTQPSEWMTHFRELVASRDLRTTLSEKGRERVRQFTWAQSSHAYLEIMTAMAA